MLKHIAIKVIVISEHFSTYAQSNAPDDEKVGLSPSHEGL